jgi:hypothetical protein
MKRSNPVFENVIILISAALALAVWAGVGDVFLLAFWWLIFGALQLLHSFIIGFAYWKQLQIRKAIVSYWIATALDLGVLYANHETMNSESLDTITIIVLPVVLAFCLWYITFVFRMAKKKPELSQN